MGFFTLLFCMAFVQIAVGQTPFTALQQQAFNTINTRGQAQNPQVARALPGGALSPHHFPTPTSNNARPNLANLQNLAKSNTVNTNYVRTNLNPEGFTMQNYVDVAPALDSVNSNPNANLARLKANSVNVASPHYTQANYNHGNLKANNFGVSGGRLANTQPGLASGVGRNFNGNFASLPDGGAFEINGNPFQFISSPGNDNFGLRVAADALEIGGTVSVTGTMPIHGTVSIKGNLPTAGAGSVNYGTMLPGAKV